MKKKMIPIALFAVLATMSVSCQKENVMDLASETTVAEASTVYTVQYSKTNDERRLSKFYVPGQPLPDDGCDATIVDAWYESRDYRYHIVNNEVVEVVKK